MDQVGTPAEDYDHFEDQLPAIQAKLDVAVENLKADRAERAEFQGLAQRVITLILILLAVTMLVEASTAYGVWNIIQGRSVNRDTQARILDCTNPDGVCAKAQAKSQQAVIDQIIKRGAMTTKEIEACSYLPKEKFPACVDKALAKN